MTDSLVTSYFYPSCNYQVIWIDKGKLKPMIDKYISFNYRVKIGELVHFFLVD